MMLWVITVVTFLVLWMVAAQNTNFLQWDSCCSACSRSFFNYSIPISEYVREHCVAP